MDQIDAAAACRTDACKSYSVHSPSRPHKVAIEKVDGAEFWSTELSQLESLAFELQRYMKHVHQGPYQELPAQWALLKSEITSRGESIRSPSLENYGHHCDDPSKQETTILIGLIHKSFSQ